MFIQIEIKKEYTLCTLKDISKKGLFFLKKKGIYPEKDIKKALNRK
jgi:hypothetical protein